MDSTQNIISLCTGIRGIERGIERAGVPIRVVAYVEIEAFICANLVAAMEAGVVDSAPIWSNLKTFDGRPFRGKVHGIIGGYPCQPFSVAGQRKGQDDPRHLWPFIREIIRTINPVWCFFENVPGHLKLGFSDVYQDLRSLGYSVEAGLFSAQEVGATHVRQRLFILANSNIERSESIKEDNRRRKYFKKRSEIRANSRPSGAQLGNPHSEQRSESTTRRQHEAKAGSASKELAYASCKRDRKGKQKSKPSLSDYNGNKWPARPGQQQHEWEEPRTVESGMGCTIDGYNFRTDILRSLGNAVVEQTAAKAWTELTTK